MQMNASSTSAGAKSRREFIKSSATAAAAVAATGFLKTPVYGQDTAPSAGVLGANNKLTVAFVGVGGQGLNAHVRNVTKFSKDNNTAPVAVCDVSKHRVEEAKKVISEGGGGQAEGYEDFRKVMERKDVDVVFVATVDHWHTRVAIAALESGKHVYVEKPMTRYLGEAFQIYDTVKRTGKKLQVGSQGCSDLKWHKAAELIRAGRIGPVVMAQGSYMRNAPKGEWNYTKQTWATAEDINWKVWIGDQIKTQKDFDPDDYFRWRKYQPYCSGLLGDLFPHKLHPYMLATGNPEFPKRVSAVGSKPVHTDKNTPDTRERDVPEIIQLIAEFPSSMVMHITSSTVNEFGTQEVIRGHKANLFMAGNKVELQPEKAFSEEIDAYTSEPFPKEDVPPHHKNFFESIRANKEPNCGIELAIRVQTVISLAEQSERMSMMCLFDEKTRKITDGAGREVKPMTYGSINPS
jgi:predicted dehydrogenase